MTVWGKALAWAGAIVGALAAVGLVIVAVAVDLDTADRAATVVGAVVGVAALGVSVYALLRPQTPAPLPAASSVTYTTERSVTAGGNISGNVSTGDRLTAPAAPAPSPTPAGTGTGPGSTAPGATTVISTARSVSAGGDITGTVTTGDTTSAPGSAP